MPNFSTGNSGFSILKGISIPGTCSLLISQFHVAFLSMNGSQQAIRQVPAQLSDFAPTARRVRMEIIRIFHALLKDTNLRHVEGF